MNARKANVEGTVTGTLLQWMAVHGYLCLALRHPQANGPSRQIALHVVDQLEKLLVEGGLLSREEMAEGHQVEAAEGPS